MALTKEDIVKILDDSKIKYEIVEHKPVYTIDEMLECNLPLSAKIKTEKIAGKEVFSVNNDYLIACFDEDVNEEVITAVAKRRPYYFIMRDKSLSSDNVADNFEQIFQAYSKETTRYII